MKPAAFALLALLAVQPSIAADQPLIPHELNRVLSLIQPGMSGPVVESIIRTAYPNMAPQPGDWSGSSGTYIYKLDDHYTLAVAFEVIGSRQLVHRNVQFIVYERPANRRITLSLYTWHE